MLPLFPSTRHRRWLPVTVVMTLALGAPAFAADATAPDSTSPAVKAEAPFLAENNAAMSKMMDGMGIAPSGNVDQDFAGMMIAHQQGAIDMAQAELRHGHNEALRRIAQEIIVEQQQEIAAMHLALGQTLPPSVPSPDQIGGGATPAMIRPPMSTSPAQ
jgi:hypothetical protein